MTISISSILEIVLRRYKAYTSRHNEPMICQLNCSVGISWVHEMPTEQFILTRSLHGSATPLYCNHLFPGVDKIIETSLRRNQDGTHYARKIIPPFFLGVLSQLSIIYIPNFPVYSFNLDSRIIL